MIDAPNAAYRVTLPVMAGLISSVESSDARVQGAQAAMDAVLATHREDEATVDEIEDALDRGLHPGVIGGGVAAGAAVLLGGLYALRRRGAGQADDADRAIEDMSVSRREMLAVMALGGVGMTGVGTTGFGDVLQRGQLPAAEAVPDREALNVLAIMIDDLNDYPTFMGGAPMPVHTPNLDALAAESRAFVNHHVTVPICPPSRSTLMWGFGVDAHEQTASDLEHAQYDAFSATWADESLIALAERQNVDTYGGGKVFHGEQFPSRWTRYYRNTWPTSAPGNAVGFDHGPLLDDRNPDEDLTNEMIAALADHPVGKPFLMLPGFRLPHLPWRVPQQYLDLHPLADIVLPETPEDDWSDLGPVATAQLEQYTDFWQAGWFQVVEDQFDRRELLQAYLASMSHTDAMVGRLLDALASSPHADSTVVMLVSDNGYHQGENFAYRKLTLRSQATRTPFMIRGLPGIDLTPETITDPIGSTNFMPTILDFAGMTTDVPRSGQSLRGDVRPSPVALSHVHNSVSAIYTDAAQGSWRWTMHFAPGQELDIDILTAADVTEMELYDQITDPGEFDNLLA